MACTVISVVKILSLGGFPLVKKIVVCMCCSGQNELRNSAFESYKKPSSRSGSQTDLSHSADEFLRFVLLHSLIFCLLRTVSLMFASCLLLIVVKFHLCYGSLVVQCIKSFFFRLLQGDTMPYHSYYSYYFLTSLYVRKTNFS